MNKKAFIAGYLRPLTKESKLNPISKAYRWLNPTRSTIPDELLRQALKTKNPQSIRDAKKLRRKLLAEEGSNRRILATLGIAPPATGVGISLLKD